MKKISSANPTGNMNADTHGNSKRKGDGGIRLFASALKGVERGTHTTLPQPNYEEKMPESDAFKHRKSSHSFRRTNSYSDPKHSGNAVGRTHNVTNWPRKAEIFSRYKSQRARSNSHSASDRSYTSRNKCHPVGSDNYSSECLSTQNTYTADSSYSGNLSSSADEHRSVSKVKCKLYADDPVSESFVSENSQVLSTVGDPSFSDSFQSSCKITPSLLHGENEHPIESMSCSTNNDLYKEVSGFPESSSGYESLDDASICSNFLYPPQLLDNVNLISSDSNESDNALMDGFIPPPIYNKCIDQKKNENVTASLTISSGGDLNEERIVSVNCSTDESTSSLCSSIETNVTDHFSVSPTRNLSEEKAATVSASTIYSAPSLCYLTQPSIYSVEEQFQLDQKKNENLTVFLPVSPAGHLSEKQRVLLNRSSDNSASSLCNSSQMNFTNCLLVSATRDLPEERGEMVNVSTSNSVSSSLCNLIQTTTHSVEEPTSLTVPESSVGNVADVLSVEDPDSDEFNDSSSNIDVTDDQFEAISKLLVETEKQRISGEANCVKDVVEALTRVVKKCIKGCWLEPYGSYVSGFAIGTSDINISLIPDKHIASSHKMLQEMIRPILKEIPDCEPVFDGDQDYRNASVSFFEPTSNICCKIRILGNDSLCSTAKLLRHFGELDSRVKTLVIAVRHWSEVCEIHEAENGRLHPLNYVLMMVHFLQQHDPPVIPIADPEKPLRMKALEENKQPAGELWLAFFKYYAESFNWKDNVVSIISKDPVLKSSKPWGKCWIAVEEPYDKGVNVAKSVVSQDVSNFIRMCFLNTYKYFLHPTTPDVLDTSSDQADAFPVNGVSTDNGENLSRYNYDFFPDNFLNGLYIPVVCSTCERLGHLCDACLYDETSMLQSLPKMTPEFLVVINKALERIYDCHRLSEANSKSRLCLIKKLESCLQKQFRGARVELIGSSRNGFGLNHSDVDICLTLEGKSAEQVDAKDAVKKIKNVLRKNREFTDVMYICTSKIPLVKFIEKRTKLRCDISVYNKLAVYNTRLLQAYSMIDERVRMLGCAMKILAKNACIDDTAQRTLSSYSYILMVLYFLQQIEPPVIPVLQELYYKNGPMPENIVENQNAWFFEDIKNLDNVWDGRGKNRQSVGELWVALLEFYTTKFDFHHFISISQKNTLVELKNVSSSMLFNIQDPFIKDLNLGKRMSGSMSRRTLKTLQRARVLFGTPLPNDKPPSGFQSFEEYFFNPMNLTDGRVMGQKQCSLCGKLGHREDGCKRYKLNVVRFWNKVPPSQNRRQLESCI